MVKFGVSTAVERRRQGGEGGKKAALQSGGSQGQYPALSEGNSHADTRQNKGPRWEVGDAESPCQEQTPRSAAKEEQGVEHAINSFLAAATATVVVVVFVVVVDDDDLRFP